MLPWAIIGERNNGHSFRKSAAGATDHEQSAVYEAEKEWGGTCTCAGRCTRVLLLVMLRCAYALQAQAAVTFRGRRLPEMKAMSSAAQQGQAGRVGCQRFGAKTRARIVHCLQAELEARAPQTLIPSMMPCKQQQQLHRQRPTCNLPNSKHPPRMQPSKPQASPAHMQTSRRTRCRRPRRCPAGRSRRSR